jgi:hypothetical protein
MEEASLSSMRIGFSLREVHAGFVVHEIALGHIYLRAFNFLLSVPFQISTILIHSPINDDI